MNTYYLKKYRKKAKQSIRIIFQNNEYNVTKYNHVAGTWELIHKRHPNCNYSTPNLCVAEKVLAGERRKYILELVKRKRDFNKNKELAKL